MYILIEKLQGLITKWKKLYVSYNISELDFALYTLASCTPRLFLSFFIEKLTERNYKYENIRTKQIH